MESDTKSEVPVTSVDKPGVPLTFCGGGSAPSALLPPGAQPLVYQNCWDPRLVEVAGRNIRHAWTLELPELMQYRVRPGKVAIVGSAPSVMDHLDRIREIADDPRNAVFVVNYAHPLLKKHGIRISGACLFEIEARAYDCLEDPAEGCTYYICSICDPTTFAKLEGQKRIVWHCMSDQACHNEALKECFGRNVKVPDPETKVIVGRRQMPLMLGGGFTTFLRTLNLVYVLGWRDYELFGVDSSYPGENSHFFGTPNYGGDLMRVSIGFHDGTAYDFNSKSYLIRQADEFRQFIEGHGLLMKIKVWGDKPENNYGLLPLIHRKMDPQMYEDADVR